MEHNGGRRAWLLLAAGDSRAHAGNEGYDDQFDAYYSWDSNVVNAKNISQGDLVVLWDKERLLGTSVVEGIEVKDGRKVLSRCPFCNTTRIQRRVKELPPYRCSKCRRTFDQPVPDIVNVTLYQARYDAGWTSLEGVLRAADLRTLAASSPGDFNPMRRLDWTRFARAIQSAGAGRSLGRVEARADLAWPTPEAVTEFQPAQGFSRAWVRVRRGQQDFRQRILEAQGEICAFTGAAPARVLEAGHLYSYAAFGTHYKHGGLMLRRDIHRLFDDGLLAVEPKRLTIDVDSTLGNYRQYAALDGQPLRVKLRDSQVDWLAKHWAEFRG